MRARSGIERGSVVIVIATLILAARRQPSGPPVPQPAVGAKPVPIISAVRATDSTEDAANVVRTYYQSINERRYDDAYQLWASDGAASGKSLEAFRDGFAGTTSVDVVLGTPGRIEGAAGSRYVEIPVRLTAIATDGSRLAFIGTYTLRRSVVDGATPQQRAWRIHSARIQRAR